MIQNFMQHKIRYLITIGGVVLVIFLSIFVYFLRNNSVSLKSSQSEETSKPAISLDDKSPDEQLGVLKLRGVVNIPSISSELSIQASTLPQDLLGFFGTNIKDIKTQSVNFSTGQTGFYADFVVSKNGRGVIEEIASRSSASSWKILYAVYSKKAALIDLDNENYQASVEVTLLADSVASIHVTLIKK